VIGLKEAIDKYGKVDLYFVAYYKYSFCFCGKMEDGTEVVIGLGGNANDMYKLEVERNRPEHLNEDVKFARVKNGEEVILDYKEPF
jgi:hypothetical protein